MLIKVNIFSPIHSLQNGFYSNFIPMLKTVVLYASYNTYIHIPANVHIDILSCLPTNSHIHARLIPPPCDSGKSPRWSLDIHMLCLGRNSCVFTLHVSIFFFNRIENHVLYIISCLNTTGCRVCGPCYPGSNTRISRRL